MKKCFNSWGWDVFQYNWMRLKPGWVKVVRYRCNEQRPAWAKMALRGGNNRYTSKPQLHFAIVATLIQAHTFQCICSAPVDLKDDLSDFQRFNSSIRIFSMTCKRSWFPNRRQTKLFVILILYHKSWTTCSKSTLAGTTLCFSCVNMID